MILVGLVGTEHHDLVLGERVLSLLVQVHQSSSWGLVVDVLLQLLLRLWLLTSSAVLLDRVRVMFLRVSLLLEVVNVVLLVVFRSPERRWSLS